MKESQKKESFVLKYIILFTIVFTIINIYIYYHIEDSNTKIYVMIFYVMCLINMIYLYCKNSKPSITISSSTKNIITIDLTKNPEYKSNSSKVIYWGIDFNVHGMVDIVNGKVIVPINNKTSLKYRIVDINEKLSNIYDVI
jgi:hypothetical protein